MLLTLEEGEQRELLRIAACMHGDKRPLLVGRAIEGVQFMRAEGCFETRIGSAFDGRHTWQAPGEVSEKG